MKSMRKQLFLTVSLLIICAVLAITVFSACVGYSSLYSAMCTKVRNEAALISRSVNDAGESYLTEEIGSATDCRITLIDTDGTVLFDSYAKDTASLENHASRTEVQEALKNGTGESTRHSVTIDKTSYYYAVRLDSGKVLRVAGTVDSVLQLFLNEFLWILLFTAVLLAAALFMTGKMTGKIVAPINSLNLDQPMCNSVYSEIRPLICRIDEQNETIRKQVADISRSREEYLAVTENMQDGLIVTNRKAVLSMNRAAMRFFHVKLSDVEGRNLLTLSREPALGDAWNAALSGKHYDSPFEMEGRVYELLGNPVLIDGQIHGAVLLMLDITEKQQTEKMRREFTANVSHELKTPLMSISGYAELIETGMAKKKDIPEFAGKIRSESARLTSLVEDIIRLSELDEKKEAGDEIADLLEIAEEAKDNLNFTAHRFGISLSVSGNSEILHGSRSLLYEMIRNLIDNGIRYNTSGGYVRTTVGDKDGHPFVSVEDNGIGIPDEDKDRIFERFYRVDKSHSRATGGTGLGLSIVKHAVLLHKGTIHVDSRIGEGTAITIDF
ncbi:MAG: ATP-binding protein [Lachnospiraceae bacterium]|jgi:two-component system phosphate regulon sensor histidine kinase PhoR|nr:ATP-binding protein [Lachnospiraceae bacterium]MCI1727109.1 ATP-binding protein [Lachnospiraceae bacterium]